MLINAGIYRGDGTTCDPYPCDTLQCTTNVDCDDHNFCNGNETCLNNVCQSGTPPNCADDLACTHDSCDESVNACVHTLIECNHDGVCDAPCENAENCINDCSSTCTAIRDLSDGSMTYCPEEIKTVHITLNAPTGALTGAVEDAPPAGWTLISNISDGGQYDSTNHKVKWGPFFAPFPSELTYDVVPPADAIGMLCFTGVAAFDGEPGELICGDGCIEDSCCPDQPADEPQSVCAGCSDECTATPGDGRVELCEVIRYACAWKRGCNDDLTGVSGAAFVWMTSECYCWDIIGMSWRADTCGQSPSGCCGGVGQGQVSIAAVITGSTLVTVDSVRRGFRDKSRGYQITVSIDPPIGTSAIALDLQIPKGLVVSVVSNGGEWDRLHGKVKWGPFFSDQLLTVTVTVYGSLRRDFERNFIGTVSYDGKNYPIVME